MTSERFRIAVAVAILVLVGVSPHAQGRRPDPAGTQLLVKYKTGATNVHREAALARVRAKLRARFAHVGIDAVDVAAGLDAIQAAAALELDPSVEYAQPNYTRSIVRTAGVTAATPNDPAWTGDSMWALNRISAPPAWSAFPPAAHDIIIAVIDTGINYRHPDLAGSVWVNPGEIAGNGIDDDRNGYVDDVRGIDTINNDTDPFDDNGHGTHTAGTIGAQGNNGIGGVGVAWNPQILSCKALDAAGNGTDAAAIACFDYLIDLKVNRGIDIRITSNSWGSARNLAGPFPQAMKDAIDAAGRAGIVSVFAAGNNGTSNESAPFDPASFTSDPIVSVAASDENDARPGFSNYGGVSVDLAAPGVNIFSTYGDGYAYSSGTSMAAPHVAGTLVLMLAQNASLTPAEAKARLLSSVDRLPAWAGTTVTGGRLNVFQALMAATESVTPGEFANAGWSHADIGATGAAGDASLANGTFQVSGAGADVWGTADALHFAYRTLTGDGTIVARVNSIQNVHAWTKAGVMIRNSLSPSAAQAYMLVAASPLKGVPFQRRVADGASSLSSPGSQSTAPRWVKLVRTGAVITGYESADGASWTMVGTDRFTLGNSVIVGLAVSSHVTGTPATALFDNVAVIPAAAPVATAPLPSGWSAADVGAVGVAGDARANAGTFTVKGAGADVWGTADAFQFAYTSMTGDGTIVARVSAVQQDVAAWVKAGVMIRDSLTPGAAHAFMLASAGKGLAFQRRSVANDISVNTAGAFASAPRWVKLRRAGNVFSAYESVDGAVWTLVGSDTIPMGATVYVGLAVSSHSAGAAATCTFDSVSIQ